MWLLATSKYKNSAVSALSARNKINQFFNQVLDIGHLPLDKIGFWGIIGAKLCRYLWSDTNRGSTKVDR